MPGKSTNYLDYLDKEMTIMGILSTFSVAVAALVLDRVGLADPEKPTLFSRLWLGQSHNILIGSLCMMVASGLFYKQRSDLAWYYGQISLSIEDSTINGETDQWYRDADSWTTWIPYHYAFAALIVGGAFYGYALCAAALVPLFPMWILILSVVVGLAILTARMLIYRQYRYDDDPIDKFFKRFKVGPNT